jgi:hypothetical protein
MVISLDDLEKFSIPMQESALARIFMNDNGDLPSVEHQDQISVLTAEASNYLWDFERKIRIGSFYPDIQKYFKSVEQFNVRRNTDDQVKKWLYRKGIPFKNKVFLSFQPHWGLVMTWKMVIHYSANIFFAYDLTVWDRTINWCLYFHHDDVFHFGSDRIYDGQDEQLKLNKLIQDVNKKNERNG